MQKKFIYKNQFQQLLNTLSDQGYRVIGPQVKEGAIVYSDLGEVSQLPQGLKDEQKPGSYQLTSAENPHYFAWANGPQALKPLTFSPKESLWSTKKHENGQIEFENIMPDESPKAIIGVRACDLAALALQDKHFLQSEYQDDYYKKRSENLFLIAVNCTHPAETCFCVSTGDGPQAKAGYDLALTELDDGFIIDIGSGIGESICEKLSTISASKAHYESEGQLMQQAIEQQNRRLPSADLRTFLPQQTFSEYWSDVGERCLACGNCTAVCPTCFCHSEADQLDVQSQSSIHYRQWDSCFNHQHSYIHGIVIREVTGSKYRQWLTHKFANWFEQYGRSGCVGCGRCITWCPVGIDVTEELQKVIDSSHDTE